MENISRTGEKYFNFLNQEQKVNNILAYTEAL